MSRHEQKRRQWQSLVARFERSGTSQAAFAAEAGVGLPSFRYWLYKLRAAVALSAPAPRATPGQASRGSARSAEVRLVPVQLRGGLEPEEGSVEVDVATLRLCVRGRADPRYVALLVGALRGLRC
jgi:hypothetical protein